MKKILGNSRAKELPKVEMLFQKVEIDTGSCYIIHVKNYFEKKGGGGGSELKILLCPKYSSALIS